MARLEEIASKLQAEIADLRPRFDKWALEDLNTAEAHKESHIMLMQHASDLIKDLQAQKEQSMLRVSEKIKVRESERQMEERLASELQHLKMTEQEARQDLMRMKEDLLRQDQELDREMAELEDTERVKRSKEQALLLGAHMYRKFLGVRFEHSSKENLKLIFTNLDPSDHKREFYFVLHVTETYTVVECMPPLKRIGALVAEVNRTNDFSLFVRSVRKQFQSLVVK